MEVGKKEEEEEEEEPRAADRERVSLPLGGFTWRVTIPASGLHATASGLLLAACGVWRVAGDPSRPP